MSVTWNTKYGKRRVKVESPTIEEAFFAAETMTDDVHQRIEIAASLMGLTVEEVRAKAPLAMRKQTILSVSTSRGRGPNAGPTSRTVVVEKKKVRRPMAPRALASA